jgi:hypothetical protein
MARLSEREFYSLSLVEQLQWILDHTDEENWINWPFMPLKKVLPGGDYDTGFLFAKGRETGIVRIYEGNIFMIGAGENVSYPYVEYEDAQDAVNDGWRVD